MPLMHHCSRGHDIGVKEYYKWRVERMDFKNSRALKVSLCDPVGMLLLCEAEKVLIS